MNSLARWFTATLVAVAAITFLAGCGMRIPSDPGGTLTEVTGGTLRVGVSHTPGLIEATGDGIEGPLVATVESFAEEHDATVEWTVQSEEQLVGLLQQDEIDLAVGGFTEESPWTGMVGMSRSYSLPGTPPETKCVMLVQLGENEFLTALETFLDDEVQP